MKGTWATQAPLSLLLSHTSRKRGHGQLRSPAPGSLLPGLGALHTLEPGAGPAPNHAPLPAWWPRPKPRPASCLAAPPFRAGAEAASRPVRLLPIALQGQSFAQQTSKSVRSLCSRSLGLRMETGSSPVALSLPARPLLVVQSRRRLPGQVPAGLRRQREMHTDRRDAAGAEDAKVP